MRFRILGPLEVLDGARSVRLGASKPRALLGVLLLHANEVVSTARLVDELWESVRPPPRRSSSRAMSTRFASSCPPIPSSRRRPATGYDSTRSSST